MSSVKKLKTVDDDTETFESINNSNEQEKNYNEHFGQFRIDSDLFKDDSYKPNLLIQVKRVNSNKIGENWDIMENGKQVLRLKGDKFSNKEKEFLRTLDGIKFVMDGYKSGWKSLNKFKQEVKVVCDNSKRNKKNK